MARLSDLHDDTFMVIGGKATRADTLAGKQGADPGPATISAEAVRWRERAQVCRDLVEETVEGYIAQWEGESEPEYKKRRDNAAFGLLNLYEEAVGGLVDQVFAREIQQDGVPAKVEEFLDNVERRKRAPVDVSQFLRQMSSAELAYGGNPLILIDHTAKVDATDSAEEDEAGGGPFFVPIHPWAILDAREDSDGNLERLRYVSNYTEADGEFGATPQGRIIMLERGDAGGFSRRRVFLLNEEKEYKEDTDQAQEFDPGNVSATIKRRFREIPVVDMSEWWAEPKLRGVAMLNVLHFRKRTDFDVAESVASVPMKAFIGFSEPDMSGSEWGPFRYVRTEKTPGEVAVEDISFSFETSKTAMATLDSIQRYIEIKSKDPQSKKATGEEKSTIRMMDEAKRISRLQAWAMRWLMAGQAATEWAAAWMGIEADSAGRLFYLPEVFQALTSQPLWVDFAAFQMAVIDSPPETWEWQISEAKRYGIISDERPTEELMAMFATAESGGGLDDEE